MPDALRTRCGGDRGQRGGRGKRAANGDHWAASLHMVNHFANFKLATQITRYEMNIDADNFLGTDELIPMGPYDFAWPASWIR